MIIHNATIHSPIERFATAMQIEGESIVWMGEEDTAHYRMKAFPDEQVMDAQGVLITPSFHNAYLAASSLGTCHRWGVSAAHVVADGESTTGAYEGVDVTPILSASAPEGGIRRLPSGATSQEIRDFLGTPSSPLTPLAITLETEADVREFLALHGNPVPAQARIYLSSHLQVPTAALTGWQVVIAVGETIEFPIASLAQEGIPFALGGEGSPWDLVARALFAENGPISARAAFNAITRGAWRLTPGQYEPRGVLAVGARADFALWDVDTLAVQAPDSDASMWSTDQRAGTPLLPALGVGESLPTLTSLFSSGSLLEG